MVGITSPPLVEIGSNDLSKSVGGGDITPCPPLSGSNSLQMLLPPFYNHLDLNITNDNENKQIWYLVAKSTLYS